VRPPSPTCAGGADPGLQWTHPAASAAPRRRSRRQLRAAPGRGGPHALLPRTRAYIERRTKEGLSKPEIMRCVKRYLAREVDHAILADFQALHAP
jgi:hypothetical protein